MKTEPQIEKVKSQSGSLWGALIGFILLGSSLSAILRLLGAWQDRPNLVLYGVAGWKINWLLVSAAVLSIGNLLVWFFLWQRRRGFLSLAWIAFVINLLSYWAERLFVWSADQNLKGNLWFMIILFGLYLALMVLFTLDIKKKVRI